MTGLIPEKTECLTNKQKVALKNIIEAARERVWMSEPLYPRLKTDGFTREIPTDSATAIVDSADILENYLNDQNRPKE